MSKAFKNELVRALRRPDAEQLRRTLKVHYQHHQSFITGSSETLILDDTEADELNAYLDLMNDPNRAFAFVMMAAANCDDRGYLFMVAAGPLEDLLRTPSPDMLDRIVAEAGKTPRFRWMLTGVLPHSIQDAGVRRTIIDAIGGVRENDPMPSAPWA